MSDESLGKISGKGNKTYEAKWNPSDGQVYVKAPGGAWTSAGKAHNSSEAFNLARAKAN